jgi:DNA-directed RNA polymerase subunit RPC12/RpoP
MKKYKEFIIENIHADIFPMTIASKKDLTIYYICQNCNTPLISLNKKKYNCDKCGSNKMNLVDEIEYYSYIKSIVSPKGWNIIQKKRKEFENELMDIIPQKKYIN